MTAMRHRALRNVTHRCKRITGRQPDFLLSFRSHSEHPLHLCCGRAYDQTCIFWLPMFVGWPPVCFLSLVSSLCSMCHQQRS